MREMKLEFTEHAMKRMVQRKLSMDIVSNVVNDPDFTEMQDDGCVRYFKYEEELKFYVRVVCRGDLVITAMPDRGVKRRR